jgi:hypothetical protein
MLLENALRDNRPDFIDLILEQGIDLQEFLSTKTLESLYKYENVNQSLLI